MATNIDAAWPELVLPPGATITVELDNAAGIVTKLNVYGFTPAKVVAPEYEVLPPLLAYGPTE
jgi:hypothetical protein